MREDPVSDASHPARNQQFLVPSGGVGMNALFLLASGQERKPTLVLLHGLPGNEQNLDLAQAIRRAGWNVLTLHYRGSWGSPGRFSIASAVYDAASAIKFLRRDDTAAKYAIDVRRVVIGGHSMGGFAAARYAATHDDVAGLILIDAWNVGADARALRAKPESRSRFEAGIDDLGNSLVGADAKFLTTEVITGGEDWDLINSAPRLARLPVLSIWADRGIAEQNVALAAAIERADEGQLTTKHFPADHAFVDFRIALAQSVVSWLDGVSSRSVQPRSP
ncbi:MAG: alpha/beta fold hydrolase [Lysobacterales bacterium]